MIAWDCGLSPIHRARRTPQPETRSKQMPMKSNKPAEVKDPSSKRALDTALRILTPRDHSKYELVQKLKQRGFSRVDIDDAISSCVRLDYINDDRTAKVYIRQLKRRGYGKKRIQLELTKKGLKGDRILDILDQRVSEADERQAAARMLKKNIRRFERETDRKKRRDKMYRFLLARGFLQSVIRESLKRYDQPDYSESEPSPK